MASSNPISAEIQVQGTFRVVDALNQFKLLIRNGGEEDIDLFPCTFYLTAKMGTSETALVENSRAAVDIAVTRPAYIEVTSGSSNGSYEWKMRASDEYVFEKGKSIEISFSNVKSRTDPGTATLTFESTVDGETKTQPLEIKKTADQPGIIYFFSTTKERSTSIWPAAEKILENEQVTLNWRVNGLKDLKLQRDDGYSIGNLPDQGEKNFTSINTNTDFVLSGMAGQDQVKARVSVNVVQTRWYSWTETIEGEELEPVLLFSANNQRLYGVLRRPSTGKSLLFQAENPFWGWIPIGEAVPPEYVGSPGVYVDDKLWFVGGSQIDPEETSNQVACFDPKNKTWMEMKPEKIPWKPRMGHAVLEFDGKIWVLGGCNENGNALNEVWTMAPQTDPEKNEWIRSKDLPWTARCMFTCVKFGNEIWAYGGFQHPFTGDFLPDLYIYSQGNWAPSKLMDNVKPVNTKIITACLRSFKNSLQVVGKISDPVIKPLNRRLTNRPAAEWTDFITVGLEGWGEDRNLSYQMVNYKDKFLIAKALGYEKRNTSLKIYVPEKIGGRFTSTL